VNSKVSSKLYEERHISLENRDKPSVKQTGLPPAPLLAVSLCLILIWGSAYTIIDVAVRTVSPEWLVAGRMLVGAVLVSIYCRSLGLRLPPLKDRRWLWYFVIGLTGASLPFVLIATGQKSVDSGLTAILVGTMPLITVGLAHIFTDEKLNRWKSLGFVIGFMGIVVLFLPKEFSFTLIKHWKAQLLILAAAVSYAATAIIAARAPETPPAIGATMLLITGAIISCLWALGTTGFTLPELSGLDIIYILALGIGSTAIGSVTYLWVIDRSGPSLMAKINYFVPACSVILGAIFLSEVLDWRIYTSLAIIVIGVIIARKGK